MRVRDRYAICDRNVYDLSWLARLVMLMVRSTTKMLMAVWCVWFAALCLENQKEKFELRSQCLKMRMNFNRNPPRCSCVRCYCFSSRHACSSLQKYLFWIPWLLAGIRYTVKFRNDIRCKKSRLREMLRLPLFRAVFIGILFNLQIQIFSKTSVVS